MNFGIGMAKFLNVGSEAFLIEPREHLVELSAQN
jgi:hypothetical protein